MHQDHGPRLQELDSEYPALDRGQDGEDLLEAKDDEEYRGANEEADDPATVPRVRRSAEIDGHHARDHGSAEDNGADPVDLDQLLLKWHAGSRLEGRKQEQPGRRQSRADTEVDVCTISVHVGKNLGRRHSQKPQRQPALLLVKPPPMMGPSTVPRPQVRPVNPIYIGRSCSVVVTESRVMTPAYRPTPPRPQSARPKISRSMELAAPQRADPASNRNTVNRYIVLASN